MSQCILSSVYLCIYLSSCVSIHLIYVFIHLSIHLSTYTSNYHWIYTSIYCSIFTPLSWATLFLVLPPLCVHLIASSVDLMGVCPSRHYCRFSAMPLVVWLALMSQAVHENLLYWRAFQWLVKDRWYSDSYWGHCLWWTVVNCVGPPIGQARVCSSMATCFHIGCVSHSFP